MIFADFSAKLRMTSLLFVYGTLKRGQRSHHLLLGQEFLGEARTVPVYRLYDAGLFPVLVDDRANGVAVQGEVWRVDEVVLKRLDEWEGVPELYSRRPVVLEKDAGPVCAYFFNGDVAAYADCGRRWPPPAG
jgi:gamma-glutamylaminecyclotransferase